VPVVEAVVGDADETLSDARARLQAVLDGIGRGGVPAPAVRAALVPLLRLLVHLPQGLRRR
jgi:hypothetical protein